ncbi:MAG: hypothetical protein ACXAD7_20630, partial [Candidatus Kariarchaeaceae archaeon]
MYSNLKWLLLVILIMGFTPMNIQTNVTAEADSVTTFKPYLLNSNHSDFKIEINGIYRNTQPSSLLEEIFPGVYQDISTNIITPYEIDFSFSGYTTLPSRNVSIGNTTYYANPDYIAFNETTTLGQLYAIVNGDINVITWADAISLIVALPLGDNTVSLLYVGMQGDGSYVFSHDTIIVRIREDENSFREFQEISVPLVLDITSADENGYFTGRAIEWVYSSLSWYPAPDHRDFFHPTVETDFQISNRMGNSSSLENYEIYYIDKSEAYEIELDARINSTGFIGLQASERWEKKTGLSFLFDGQGLRLLDSVIDTLTIRDGRNHLGILTLAPAGFLHTYIPFPNGSGFESFSFGDIPGYRNGLIDWEGLDTGAAREVGITVE